MDQTFQGLYSDPKQPGSFSGADKLQKALKKVKNLKVPVSSVKRWLEKKDTYTKFRTARRNFKRNPVIAAHIDAQWQGDLADVSNIAEHNRGVTFLLVLIDVVSKHMWVEPLKDKSAELVTNAFKKVFKKAKRVPKKLQTDQGTEFVNSTLEKYLKGEGITFFTLKSDKKAAIAERVIRTLKEKIYRYTHEKHTKMYINVLQALVSSYNKTYHKSIKMAPVEVNTQNEGQVLNNLYGKAWEQNKKRKKPKFKEGDFVRISSVKGVFEKGYTGNWTEEIFIIDKVKLSAVPQIMYKIKDWKGKEIDGSFYDKEIQLVSKGLEEFWKIEKVIRKRKRGKKIEYLIKWEGYSDEFNSWVPQKDVKDL